MPKSQIISTGGYGTAQFISIKGHPRVNGQGVEVFQRPGVNGEAFRKIGIRSAPFEMTAIRDFADFSAAATGFDAINNLRGTFISIYDDYGVHILQLILLDAEIVDLKPCLSHVGGVAGVTAGQSVALLTVRLTLQQGYPLS